MACGSRAWGEKEGKVPEGHVSIEITAFLGPRFPAPPTPGARLPGPGANTLGEKAFVGRTINRSHSPLVAKPRVRCGAVGLAFVRGSHRRVHGPPGSSRGGLGGGECDTRSPFLQSGRQVSAKVDGTRGAVCESSEDEGLRTTILRFSNGDVKKTLPDNRVVRAAGSAPSGGGAAGRRQPPRPG